MSYGRQRARRKSMAVRPGEDRRRGRKRRRLSLEPLFLEDRTLLAGTPPTLNDVLTFYDSRVGSLATGANLSSLVTQGFGLNVPLLQQGLDGVLTAGGIDIESVLSSAFSQANISDASDPTLAMLRQDLAGYGISVVYPPEGSDFSSTPASTGQYAGDYLVMQWNPANSSGLSSELSNLSLNNVGVADFSGTGFPYLNDGSLTGSLTGPPASAAPTRLGEHRGGGDDGRQRLGLGRKSCLNRVQQFPTDPLERHGKRQS